MSSFIKITTILLALLFPIISYGETGGPTIVEILGYNPNTRRVYFQPVDHSDSGAFPIVGFFDLNLPEPQRIQWYEPLDGEVLGFELDAFDKKLAELKATLTPLRLIKTDGIKLSVKAKRISDLRPDYFRPSDRSMPRYKLHIILNNNTFSGEHRVTAYYEKTVKMVSAFAIPEEKDIVVVVSYIGSYEYRGYEEQVPILLTRKANKTLKDDAAKNRRAP